MISTVVKKAVKMITIHDDETEGEGIGNTYASPFDDYIAGGDCR